jgi:hypothetical protein
LSGIYNDVFGSRLLPLLLQGAKICCDLREIDISKGNKEWVHPMFEHGKSVMGPGRQKTTKSAGITSNKQMQQIQ